MSIPAQPARAHGARRLAAGPWPWLPAALLDPSSAWLRRWGWLSLVGNVVIVVTGGAVRLTESGLGCPTWPRCTEASYTPTPGMGIHGVIEFGNRLLTVVLGVVAAFTLLAAIRHRPIRRDLTRLAVALALGVPLQGLIGGLTVLTDLNPWVVMLHFLASMLMIGLNVAFLHQAGPSRSDAPAHLLLGRLATGMVAVTAALVYLGAVTTGSGPHAGDADAARTGLDPALMSQIHADLMFLLVGMTIAQLVALAATRAAARARRAALGLLVVELGQGAIGYTQYVLGLPEPLVGVHMLGASLTVAMAVHLMLATRTNDRHPACGRGRDSPTQ